MLAEDIWASWFVRVDGACPFGRGPLKGLSVIGAACGQKVEVRLAGEREVMLEELDGCHAGGSRPGFPGDTSTSLCVRLAVSEWWVGAELKMLKVSSWRLVSGWDWRSWYRF